MLFVCHRRLVRGSNPFSYGNVHKKVEAIHGRGSGGKNTQDRVNRTPEVEACLVVGLLLVGVGLPLLVMSLLGYWEVMEEQEALDERLREQGLENIPGVGLGDVTAFLLTLTVIGGVMTAAGAILTSVALSKKRATKEAESASPPPQQMPTTALPPVGGTNHASRKVVVPVVVVIAVVVLAGILSFTQPWSKVEILAYNPHQESVVLRVYLDGAFKAEVSAMQSSDYVVVAVWQVRAGTHLVEIDSGRFIMNISSGQWIYEGPDGIIDSGQSELLYPFTTMKVEFYPSEGVADTTWFSTQTICG